MVAQTPQYRLDSLAALENMPVTAAAGRATQVLGGLATITRGDGDGVVSHYDVQPTIDIYANVQGRDLGGVAADIERDP